MPNPKTLEACNSREEIEAWLEHQADLPPNSQPWVLRLSYQSKVKAALARMEAIARNSLAPAQPLTPAQEQALRDKYEQVHNQNVPYEGLLPKRTAHQNAAAGEVEYTRTECGECHGQVKVVDGVESCRCQPASVKRENT
jgi:mono/diheme cytochrome c family protein